VYNAKDGNVYVYFSNNVNDYIKYTIIINDNKIINHTAHSLYEFNIFEICDFNDLRSLKFIINDTEIHNYDFDDKYLKESILKNKCIIDFKDIQ
jgi:hypothetical protein